MRFSAREIAAVVGSSYEGKENIWITDICIDTRSLQRGSLFIPLVGERFDGHQFISAALDAGAALCLCEEGAYLEDERVLFVKNTKEALLSLANFYRKTLPVKVVGVTGSVGKTSTKEMIFAALSESFRAYKTKGNLNNEIGLPKTLLSMPEDTEAAVIEMGMSAKGEIAALSKCALPDVSVITNIGVAHMEALGSRENILEAKLEIREGMPQNGKLILCGDNDLLWKSREMLSDRIIYYGLHNRQCDLTVESPCFCDDGTAFTLSYEGQQYACFIPVLGEHHLLNAAAAFAVCRYLGMEPQDIIKGYLQYRTEGMRQNIRKMGDITLIEDCYNASPDSMEAALGVLKLVAKGGRSIAVLADMLELGDISKESHFLIGKVVVSKSVDKILAFGDEARYYIEGALSAGLKDALWFSSKQAIIEELRKTLRPGDTVLFKGSRGMKLEEIIKEVFEGKE